MRYNLFLNINLQLIRVRQFIWSSIWKYFPLSWKDTLQNYLQMPSRIYNIKRPVPWLHFLSQLDTISHQVIGKVDQLILLWVKISVQSPLERYPHIFHKWPSNCQHIEAHIHITSFYLHGWNHASIHQYHQIMIWIPSASYTLSGDAKNHSLKLFPHTVPKLSSLVFLDFPIQIQFHIL